MNTHFLLFLFLNNLLCKKNKPYSPFSLDTSNPNSSLTSSEKSLLAILRDWTDRLSSPITHNGLVPNFKTSLAILTQLGSRVVATNMAATALTKPPPLFVSISPDKILS